MTTSRSVGRVQQLQIGQILRDKQPKSSTPAELDGVVNLYAATDMKGARFIPFASGINGMKRVEAVDGHRRPAILITSSPHKSGSVVTPWQDLFAPDEGYVRYFGDAKTPGEPAHLAKGNALLLEEFAAHHAHPDEMRRAQAAPLVFFQRLPHLGRQKGFPRFQGFGILTAARLVTQFNDDAGGAFANYEFECAVMTMNAEGERFDWAWINARRTRNLSVKQTLSAAPAAWRQWVTHGDGAISRVRRKVLRRSLTPVAEQKPAPGSAEGRLLDRIYAHYHDKKVYFEALAAAIAERVIAPTGAGYTTHGVTRGSGDFGVDFIAQLDVGHGFSRTALIVLGQAKCVTPGSSTNAADLARTVARLRRGWLGVFVTTGTVSERAQMEVYEDRYPLIMFTALQVAVAVGEMLHEAGRQDVEGLLTEFDVRYEVSPRVQDPERLVV